MVGEKRRQRTSFTHSLQRISERIDNASEFEVEWRDDIVRGKEKTIFRVKTLWAFGSWAKGALYCGDLDTTHWSDTAVSFYERLNGHSGKKTMEAMRFIIDWFEINDPIQTWNYDHSSRAAFTINGNFVHVGHPPIDLRRLDHHSCSGLILVPHITKRGPNGIWKIHRGTKHSLERMFQDVSAYYLKWKNQRPAVVQVHTDWRKINLIELFRKKIDAISFAHEISEESAPEYYVSEASGKELLRIISLIDQVDIDGQAYAISLEGTWFDDEDFPRPKPEELKNIFLRSVEPNPDK
jgi:hypothetical protein